jgi:hypothetical protein
MSDETTSTFHGTSADPAEALPDSVPAHGQPPQGPTQEDTQRRIFPTDPTGADPAGPEPADPGPADAEPA